MSDPIADVVKEFSVPRARFSPTEDPRLFESTRKAFEELASGGEVEVEFPDESWTREQTVEWWKTMGPAFAGVVGSWAGETPPAMEAAVTNKIDLTHEGVHVRILKKTGLDTDLPVIVYLHGGGFSAWSYKDQAYDGYLTRLAALGQCIVVAVDYRLATEAPYPAGLEDSYKVTKWVVEGGASTYGVPGGKVTVAGDSAGSNIAFGVTLKAKQEGLDLVAGLYLICPYGVGVTKRTGGDRYPNLTECNGYFASEGFLIAVCKTVCLESEKEKWFQNPLLFPTCATKEEMSGMPPTSVVVQQLDMIRDLGIELHYRLKDAGVESMLTVMGSSIHDQQLYAKLSPHLTNQSIRDLAGFAEYVMSDEN